MHWRWKRRVPPVLEEWEGVICAAWTLVEVGNGRRRRRRRRGRTSSKSLAERNFGARGDYARRRHKILRTLMKIYIVRLTV